jgi:hypothetical protein
MPMTTRSLSSSVRTLPHFLIRPRLVATVEVPDANMVGGARSLRQVQIAARSGAVSPCLHKFFVNNANTSNATPCMALYKS